MVNKSPFSSSSNMKKSVSRAMNYYYSSSITISQPWLLFLFLFISITSIFCSSIETSTSTSTNKLSYSDHCNLIVPESTTTTQEVTTFSFPNYSPAYFSGGQPFLSQNSSTNFFRELSLHTTRVYETKVNGVLKVEASLTLRNTPPSHFYCYDEYAFNGQSQSTPAIVSPGSCFGKLSFVLNGFWSEASGKVCMVGHGTTYSKQGNLLNLGVVFKINFAKNSSVVTSLSSGTLESLSSFHDSNYFKPISILMFTKMNYEYSLVLREFENGGFSGSDVPQSLPQGEYLCQIMASFKLTYPSTCNFGKNCSPFGGSIGYLPHFMVIELNECSEQDQRLRILMKFYKSSNGGGFDRTFNPNTSLIGEGLWDGKKNQLLVVACKILNATGSLGNAHVGDCSIRLSLGFPATWTIKSSIMLGQIWSSKPKNDSEYFDKIVFESTYNNGGDQGLKYEYTQIDRVRKMGTAAKKQNKTKEERYPDGNSCDMSFGMRARSSEGSYFLGHARPLFVGDLPYECNGFAMAPAGSVPMVSEVPVNISYKISLSEVSSVVFSGGNSTYDGSSNEMIPVEIELNAEGLYDVKTGGLCMVGCKMILTEIQLPTARNSLDCDILVKLQLPSLNSRDKEGGYIKGSIESMREKSDLLYFEHLELTSIAYVTSVANENIWRMDSEIILVLISNTLACVLVVLQLFHVKKHPETLPFASLIMLAVLTLSYMVPLLLHFVALFLQNPDGQNVSLESGRWIEVNETLVRLVTLVAFLLQFYHLLLTWSSRLGDGGNQKNDLWASEKKALFYVLLPVYVAGALIAGLVIWKKNNNHRGIMFLPSSSQSTSYQQVVHLGDLKSYAGLVLDGFLLPQIVLNMFGNTREKALYLSYYIGTTFIRLLPHAYDLYRAQSDKNDGRFESSYIYANHGVDFYSAAWDVTIPCVSLVFATIIFLQQRFGGRCIIPRKFREADEYEKVPIMGNE